MPRKPRILTEGGVYHIIARGNNHQALFRSEGDYLAYLDFIGSLRLIYPFDVYHYCLMTNHVHCVIRFYNQEALQKVMQRVHVKYAKLYCKSYSYHGHVFQDRFKSLPIEKESYLLECGRYVERNPLKAGLVKNLRDYLWSSYLFYAEGKPDSLLTMNPLYEILADQPGDRRQRYRKYVLVDRPYERFIDEELLLK